METELTTKPAVIRLLPIADLVDPDWNPRPFLDEPEMQLLVDHMAAGGYIPPITVLKKDPGLPDAPWQVISGKRRGEAARRLGWTQIEAIELDITLDEAQDLAISSNRDNKPYWLGEYVAVERRAQAKQSRKGVEIATKIGWTTKRVSQALVLCRLLTPASRALILEAAQKITVRNFSGGVDTPETSPKGSWTFSEEVAIRLIPLWDKENPQKSQEIADKAVRAILDRQLIGTQTGVLVAQLLSGKDLAEFDPSQEKKGVAAPSGKAGHGFVAAMGGLAAKASTALGTLAGKGGKSRGSKRQKGMGQLVLSLLKHMLPSPRRVITGVVFLGLLWLVYKGLHHLPFFKTPALFRQDYGGQAAPGNPNPGVSSGPNGQAPGTSNLGGNTSQGAQAANGNPGNGQGVSLGSGHLPTGPQAGGQALVEPNQGAEGNGGTQMGSAQGVVQGVTVKGNLSSNGVTVSPQLPSKILGVNFSGIQAPGIGLSLGGNTPKQKASSKHAHGSSPSYFEDNYLEPQVPDELKGRVKEDKDTAQILTTRFYGFSYKYNFKDLRDLCDEEIPGNYQDAFNARYFSKERWQKFTDGKMYYDFEPIGDPKLVKLTDTTDDIAVVGNVTLLGDAVDQGKVFWKKRMALVVSIRHFPDNGSIVTKVKEVNAP